MLKHLKSLSKITILHFQKNSLGHPQRPQAGHDLDLLRNVAGCFASFFCAGETTRLIFMK